MVRTLPEEALENTLIGVARPENFSVRKVAAALALSRLGLRPEPQEITVRTELLGTPQELFGSLATIDDPAAAQRISDIASDYYRRVFPSA
jgi:hypothetical protein